MLFNLRKIALLSITAGGYSMYKLLFVFVSIVILALPFEFTITKGKGNSQIIKENYTCGGYCIDKDNQLTAVTNEADQLIQYSTPHSLHTNKHFYFYQLCFEQFF